jgi:hypothetical protein
MPNFKDLRQDIVLEPEIAKILEQANLGISWTKLRQKAYDALDEVIQRYGGLEFLGDQRTYGLSTRGSHAVFRVPPNESKSLREFRGQLILIVCIGRHPSWPGYSGRRFVAMKVSEGGKLLRRNVEKSGVIDG